MNTKAIEELILDYCLLAGRDPRGISPRERANAESARAEVEAIRKAAKTATDCGTVLSQYRRSDDVWSAWSLLVDIGKESQ